MMKLKQYYQILVDIMKMFGFIGFLAISISCLGLFGMTHLFHGNPVEGNRNPENIRSLGKNTRSSTIKRIS